MLMENTRDMLADAKFFEAYSRYKDEEGSYESWEESVKRVMDMHRTKYDHFMTEELKVAIDFAEDHYKKKNILGAQRCLQFGGEQILKHQIKVYNCVSSYCDRSAFFGEFMYMLLCGAGAGFSVQHHHIAKLPKVVKRSARAKTFTIPDSIEGWAQSINVLMSSYLEDGGVERKYKGCHISFDYSKIRPKGAYISGGFKAPSAEPLRKAHGLIESLLEQVVTGGGTINSIVAYDICMHIADAVISGGVRRSATITLFSHDDQDMLTAKVGDWFTENPQRGRSNNSAVILRDEITWEEFSPIMENIKTQGEPAFVFTDSKEFTFNP